MIQQRETKELACHRYQWSSIQAPVRPFGFCNFALTAGVRLSVRWPRRN